MTVSTFLQTSGQYPDLKPTTRQFTPPSFAVSKTYSMNSRASRLLMASKPGQGLLSLTYENVSHTDANTFITAYENSYGSGRAFALPSPLYSGLDAALISYINTSLVWRWEGPPQISAIKNGVCTVSTSLRAVPLP